MKVIIAGSRSIPTMLPVAEAIVASGFDVTEVVSGRARGVDKSGEAWANLNDIPIHGFPADWSAYGKAAGSIRNADMAEYADALVAVWDGISPGTKDMIHKMERLGKPVYIHRMGT